MSTITKERAQQIFLGNGPEPTASEERELARIALASLEAVPVGEVSEQRDGLVMDGMVDLGGASAHRIIKGASKMKRLPLGTKFYTAPPAPADKNPLREFAMEYIESWGLCMAGDSSLLASARKAIADSEILQPAPVSVPDERYQHLSELYHAQEKRLFKLAQRIKGSAFDKYAHSPSQAIDVLESEIFGEREDEACRAAMLQGAEHVTTTNKLGNSPVIPDGWKLVPVIAFPSQWAAGQKAFNSAGINKVDAVYKAMVAAAPQQEA